MMLSLSLLVLLVPVLLVSTVVGSRPGECKREKEPTFKRECTVDEDCRGHAKKCCPTPSGGSFCRQPAQTCRQLDCGPNATCNHSSTSSLPFCDINECSPNPCQNNGICVDDVNSYKCTCPAGFNGPTCDININECSPNPCQNNGTCVDDVNYYKCTCPAGFNGPTCNININECSSNPCQNNGTCVDGVNSYNCTCPERFIGTTCDTNRNECSSNPCQNNGTCVVGVNSYKCTCPAGFTGTTCDTNKYVQCRPENYRVLDDWWRDVNNVNSIPGCDYNVLSPPPVWYRILLNGQNARIPTTPPTERHCGVILAVWLDLEGSTLPASGQSSVGRACSSYNAESCFRNKPGLVVFNCGHFFVYQLPRVADCYTGYCAQLEVSG